MFIEAYVQKMSAFDIVLILNKFHFQWSPTFVPDLPVHFLLELFALEIQKTSSQRGFGGNVKSHREHC